ncbi:MAG: creatininase family protein [Candidatus Heimdallarchaeaceae archaeon]
MGSLKPNPSVILENLTWIEAEEVLKRYDVVLIALGARTKEHGPHLPLNNDFIMAQYLKEKVIKEVPVAVLPTLQYGFYPSFLEYPGSISISEETFKNTIIDICQSMSGYGIKKFYIINTGISTLRPLRSACEELEKKGIILHFLNTLDVDKKLDKNLLEQEGGTHADEGETSIMLHIAPEIVDMNKAEKDYDPRPNRRGLTRDSEGDGVYSKTGIFGDPTLATKEKGKIITEALVDFVIEKVKELIELNVS